MATVQIVERSKPKGHSHFGTDLVELECPATCQGLALHGLKDAALRRFPRPDFGTMETKAIMDSRTPQSKPAS
jgi:hypothetical protein